MVDKQADTSSCSEAQQASPAFDETTEFSTNRLAGEFTDEDRYEIFNDDQLSLKAAFLYLVAALVGGSVIALASWFAFHRLNTVSRRYFARYVFHPVAAVGNRLRTDFLPSEQQR